MAGEVQNICLLVGIPSCKREFLARLPASDLLRPFRVRDANGDIDQGKAEGGWENDYRKETAAPVESLIEAALQSGVNVKRGATLHDLTEGSSAADVVIVVSHWKGPNVSADDIPIVGPADGLPQSVERIRARLSGDRSPIAVELDAVLRQIESSGHFVRIAQLVGALDGYVEARPRSPIIEHSITRMTRRRCQLDTLLHGVLSPGNRLELFDGLHDVKEVEQAIAPGFKGVLDLTTCTSSVLGEHIDRTRDRMIRTVNFSDEIPPMWSVERIVLALAFVADGYEYLDARRMAWDAIRELMRKEARRFTFEKMWRFLGRA